MANWWFNGEVFSEDMILDHIGFVYVIENKTNGKKYIGKKLFTFKKTQKPLKGKKNKRHSRVESDWKEYFGSNAELKEDVAKLGQEHFKRDIIRLCKNKGEANYHEAKQIMIHDAIVSDEYYNSWLSIKVNKNQI